MASTSISVARGDLEPDVPFRLMVRKSEDCSDLVARDLTGLVVRAFFYKAWQLSDQGCSGIRKVPSENALFLRVLAKREVDLLETTVVVSPGAALVPTVQPAAAQRISFEVTGLTVAGSIQVVGKDVDGEDQDETVAVAANGIYTTTAAFSEISDVEDAEGIVVLGEFSLRAYVHDGLADLTWRDGDTDTEGDYYFLLELVDGDGEKTTALELVKVTIRSKIQHPVPTITDVDTSPAAPGDTLTLTGTGFLDATRAFVQNLSTDVLTDLENLTINSETESVADLPAAIDGGAYSVYLETPGGVPASPYETLEVTPLVYSFTPESLSPGGSLALVGLGFTGATAIEIVDSDDVATPLDNLVVADDENASGDIPLAQASGDYRVRIVVPANQSTLLGMLTVS